MIGAGRRFAKEVSFLGAAVLMSLLPGAVVGMVAGGVLILLLPGYALLRALGAPARIGSPAGAFDCLAASLCVTPLALRLSGLVFPFDRPHVIGVQSVITLALLILGVRRARNSPTFPHPPQRLPPAALAIILTTPLLLAPALAIGPTADGGETRNKGWDLNNHLAIAESIATRGLPPLNPFLNGDAPFYYHSFFHILLGGILVVAGPAAPAYLTISLLTLLLAAIFLSTFHRFVREFTGDSRVALFSLPLVSLIGGFDVVALAARALLRQEDDASPMTFFLRHWNVDGWVSNQGMLVPTFFASYYWAPHAVAGFVVFLSAVLHLRQPLAGAGAPAAAGNSFAAGAAVVAGVCLASMAGYNGYVALAGAAILSFLWGCDLTRFLRSRRGADRDLLLRGALAAGIAIPLGLPVLRLYLSQRAEGGGFRWAQPGPLVPVQVALEFGPAILLGLIGLAVARREGIDVTRLLPAMIMGVVTLPVLCFLASTGENNDLAMRVSMFLWIGLAVFSGIALNRLFPLSRDPASRFRGPWIARGVALFALAIGSLSVAWFAIGAAVSKPALPADLVAAGRWVRSRIPPGLLVQGSPLRGNSELVYLSGHPAVLSDTWTARLFYATPEDYEKRMAALKEAFASPDPAIACPILQSLGITALIAGPPEATHFPLLARSEPWPCVSLDYEHGSYRVYRVSDSGAEVPAGKERG